MGRRDRWRAVWTPPKSSRLTLSPPDPPASTLAFTRPVGLVSCGVGRLRSGRMYAGEVGVWWVSGSHGLVLSGVESRNPPCPEWARVPRGVDSPNPSSEDGLSSSAPSSPVSRVGPVSVVSLPVPLSCPGVSGTSLCKTPLSFFGSSTRSLPSSALLPRHPGPERLSHLGPRGTVSGGKALKEK